MSIICFLAFVLACRGDFELPNDFGYLYALFSIADALWARVLFKE